jgi:hypothetical protein
MRLAFFGILLAGCAAAAGSATAQQQTLRPNETYCLEASDSSGGSQPFLCRFTTYEQCLASRTSHGDRCWLNPILAFRQRR